MTVIPFSNPPLRLGFLSPHNSFDRRAFSGTAFFAQRSLRQHPDIDLRVLGAHRPPRRIDRFRKPASQPIDPAQLDVSGLDAVIGLVATPLLDKLHQIHPNLPYLHVTDATPEFLRNCYGWSVPHSADIIEARVASRAATNVYSSEMMARRASQDLKLPDLVHAVAPFGINFETLPETTPEKPPLDKIRLLFIGLDWARKGGDIAVATLNNLRAMNRDAELTIVGHCPKHHRAHPAIRYAGFLDKNKPADTAKLARLFCQSHLLLVPSRGDCTPMVIAEAMAHGTPALATDIGGAGFLIGDKGAGRLLPPYSTPATWAAMVAKMTCERDVFKFISDASFDRAKTNFSWKDWAQTLFGLAHDAIACSDRDLKVAASA